MKSAFPPRWPMPSELASGTGTKLEQESLLPELLHALNQPLTSLRCSLELTLLQPRDSDEYRRRLRDSLKLTEEITVLASGIRELIDVENPVTQPRTLAFDKILPASVRELLPLADAQKVSVTLVCAPSLLIMGDAQQYSTAIVYLFGFLLSLANRNDEITIHAMSEGSDLELEFELKSRDQKAVDTSLTISQKSGKAKTYLRLLVARRIFEVGGGTVFVDRQPPQVAIRIRVPRVRPRHDDESGSCDSQTGGLAPSTK
jgi:hypothetical protein